MKKGTNYSAKASGLISGALLGAAVSLTVCLLGAAVLAWLVTFEKAGESAVGLGAAVILSIASAAGSAAAWSRVRKNRLAVWGAHSGVLYTLLLLAALPFGGAFERVGATAAMILAGGAVTFIPGILGHGSGGKKYKIKAFR